MNEDDGESDLASERPEKRTLFGRRKGKKLRTHQSSLIADLLPELSFDIGVPVDDPAALFNPPVEDVRLEIGFGGAEHLVFEANRFSRVGFIGCEPFLNGVAKLLVKIDELGLENLRVHHGDAREVLDRLPDESLGRVDVLYPDPWPKWRQRKRRFLSEDNLLQIARVLRPGAALRFATDIDDYAGWVLARVLRTNRLVWDNADPDAWRTPWADWPGTRYEAKAHREGRKPVYLTFRRP